MTPPESARVIAMARLHERARRISRMRKSVVAAGVATFILAWGLALNDQLANGTSTASGSTGADPATSTSSGEEGSVESDDGLVVAPSTPVPSTSVPVAPTPAPAPVTTSQS